MKKVLLISTFMLSLSSFASPEGRIFQTNVLFSRMKEIIDVRAVALYKCFGNKGTDKRQIDHFSSKYLGLGTDSFRPEKEKMDSIVEVLRLTNSHPECVEYIKSADSALNKLQRKKFLLPEAVASSLCALSLPGTNYQCLKNSISIISDLDPFCITQKNQDLHGVKDHNPCMAGDRLLGRILRKKNDPTQSEMALFLGTLETQVRAAKPGSEIDLWSIYSQTNKDTSANRKKFLGMLVLANYLGTAGGYVDGLGDQYWQSAYSEGKSGEEIFNEFYSVRNKVDWFGFIKKGVAKKKITLMIKHLPLSGMNHHNFMAMFLACHFRTYGNLVSKILPNLLGTGYESLDFVSHMREKIGFQKSVRNFETDTNRYREGSEFGNQFCGNQI